MADNSADEQYVKELRDYLKDHFSGRDDEIRLDMQAREGTDFTKQDIPEAYRSTAQLVPLPRAADTLQRMVSIVTDDDPAWEQPPVDDGDAAKRRASHVERFVQAAIERMAEDSGRDAIRMAIDSQLSKGLGVLKLVYLPDAWDDEPGRTYSVEEPQADGTTVKASKEKPADEYLNEVGKYRKTARFPLWLEDVDPLNYYPLHNGREVVEVLEISERTLLPTLQALNVKATKESGKRSYKKLRKGEKFPVNGGLQSGSREKIECIEHWKKKTVDYYIEGQKVDSIEHNYGFIPFVELLGYTTSERDPAKATRSVISSQRDLIKQLRRVLTIWLNWAYMAGWPFLEAPEGADTGIPDNATKVTQIEPGTILRHGTKFIEPPQAGHDLSALAQIFQAETDRAGLASVMYGAGAGISSGYQASTLQAAAQSILRPLIRSASKGISRIGQMLLQLIDQRIETTVYVYGAGADAGGKEWLSLGPKDIKGYYPLKATMRPLMPLDEVAQRDSAIRMYKAGLWDPETALKHTGENQPERILDLVGAYKFMEESGLNNKLGERSAAKLGLLNEPTAPPVNIFGPKGGVLSSVPQGTQAVLPGGLQGIGGPGIGAQGPMVPPVPGQGLPLVPPAPNAPAQPNPPYVPRRPGVAMPGPMPVP